MKFVTKHQSAAKIGLDVTNITKTSNTAKTLFLNLIIRTPPFLIITNIRYIRKCSIDKCFKIDYIYIGIKSINFIKQYKMEKVDGYLVQDVLQKNMWLIPALKEYNQLYEDINVLFYNEKRNLIYELNHQYNQNCIEILLKITYLNQSINIYSDEKHHYSCSVFRNPNDSVAGYIIVQHNKKISEFLMKIFVQLLSNQVTLLIKCEQLTSFSWIDNIGLNSSITADLSFKEKEVLLKLIAGKSDDEITSDLSMSKSTVRTHIRSLYDKIGANCRSEAISKYYISLIKYGFVEKSV